MEQEPSKRVKETKKEKRKPNGGEVNLELRNIWGEKALGKNRSLVRDKRRKR